MIVSLSGWSRPLTKIQNGGNTPYEQLADMAEMLRQAMTENEHRQNGGHGKQQIESINSDRC